MLIGLRQFRYPNQHFFLGHPFLGSHPIASTTTKTGLVVRAALDSTEYETGITVSDEELARLRIIRAKFHGEWNYTIKPRR